MNYTADNLRAQLAIAERELSNEQQRLASLDRRLPEVRANHKRTIEMRAAHYAKRIKDLQQRIASM